MDYHSSVFDDLRRDVAYTLRSLRRAPGFAAVAVGILALGIGAATAIFSVVHGVLLRELPYDQPERIAWLWQAFDGPQARRVNVSVPELRDYETGAASLEAVGGMVRATSILGDSISPARIPVALVTPGFFDVFNARPALGRLFSPDEALVPFAVYGVLSHRSWRSRFGSDTAIIGRQVMMSGRQVTIVGVMPPGFEFPRGTEAWRPLVIDAATATNRSRRFIDVVVRTKPDISIAAASADVDATEQRVAESGVASTRLVSLRDELTGPIRDTLLILFAAVTLLLVIACANVANLLLARAASRRREVTLRAAIGASRGRLVRQFLTESVLLSGLAAAAGAVLARLALAGVRILGDDRVPRLEEVRLDTNVLAFALGVSVLTGIAFGLVPALSLSRGDAADDLSNSRVRGARRSGRMRGVLAVSELALSLMLVMAALLLTRSFGQLRGAELGFEEDRVLTLQVGLPFALYAEPQQRVQFFDQVLSRLRAAPGVEAAGATSLLPISGANASSSAITEKNIAQGQFPEADVRSITPGYLEALGVRLLRGRRLQERDGIEGQPKVALVNEALARALWPGEEAIGRRVSVHAPPDHPDWREVVGVVADMRHGPLETGARIALYEPHRQVGDGSMSIVIRTAGDPRALAMPARAVVRSLDPTVPVTELRTMEDHVTRSLGARRFALSIVTVLSAVAIVLAAAGLYGVVSYGVAQRTNEIGVRMALGARSSDVIRLVLGEALALAGIGIAFGVAGAAAAGRFIAAMLYGVRPGDPLTLVATVALLIGVAVAASWIPARRASRVEPVNALRAE